MASKEKQTLTLDQKWKETDAMNLRWARYFLEKKDPDDETSMQVQYAREVIKRLEGKTK